MLGWWSLAAATVFVAYSLPPLRLNYRGGGELLEALGVGVVMPVFCAQWAGLQPVAYALEPGVWAGLSGCQVLGGASALASGMSDEESDRAGGKRTVASVFGNGVARRWIRRCLALGLGCWLLGGVALWIAEGFAQGAPPLLAAAVAAWPARHAARRLPNARTNAFKAQVQHKLWLHRGIWWGTGALAAGWAAVGLVGAGVAR